MKVPVWLAGRLFQWEHGTRDHKSPRRVLWIICGAVVTVIIGCGTTVTFILRERAETAYHREVKALDVALSEQTFRYVQVMDLLLQKVVVRAAELPNGSQEEFRRQFGSRETHDFVRQILQMSPEANILTITDATGRILVHSRLYPPPDFDRSNRDYFRHFLERKDNGLFVSVPFIAGANGMPMVAMARQMTAADGSFLGVVAISLSIDYLSGLYQSANVQPGQSVTLLRQDGMVLLRSPDPTHQAGTRMPEVSPWYEIASGGGGAYRSIGYLGGVPALVSVHPIKGFPLVLNVSVKEAEALAAWWQDAKWIGISTLAIAAGFMLLFWVIARQLFRWEAQHSALLRTTMELKQTVARLNAFARTGSDWFWEQDAALRFVSIGLDTPLVDRINLPNPGKQRWEIADTSRTPELWEKHIQEVMNHQPFRDFRYDRLGSDGQRRYISISGVPVHDDDGAFARASQGIFAATVRRSTGSHNR